MDTDSKWVIVRIDGKVAAISTDYRLLSEISAQLASTRTKISHLYGEISAVTAGFDGVDEQPFHIHSPRMSDIQSGDSIPGPLLQAFPQHGRLARDDVQH